MGKVSNAFKRRARQLRPKTSELKFGAGKIMVESYQLALSEEVYKRTPRPVSYRLFLSIGARYFKNSVIVGHNSSIAKYVLYRRAMKGRGFYEGNSWNKTTEWDITARNRAVPLIIALCRNKARLFFGPGVKSINGN